MAFTYPPKFPRSRDWPLVRKLYFQMHPRCAYCGCVRNLDVHHIIPVHIDPSRQLDPDNLITLCQCPKHLHHQIVGHLGDWDSQNLIVAQLCDVSEARKQIRSLQQLLLP